LLVICSPERENSAILRLTLVSRKTRTARTMTMMPFSAAGREAAACEFGMSICTVNKPRCLAWIIRLAKFLLGQQHCDLQRGCWSDHVMVNLPSNAVFLGVFVGYPYSTEFRGKRDYILCRQRIVHRTVQEIQKYYFLKIYSSTSNITSTKLGPKH